MGTRDVWHLLHRSLRALDIREKNMVYEQVDIRGDPLIKEKLWCMSKWDIGGDHLVINHGV